MASTNRASRQQRMKEKAQTLFYIYYQMGIERTFTKLAEICGAIRVKASQSTLERYSTTFEWQRQILELDNKASEVKEAEVLREVDQMNTRHAQYSQALLGLFSAGVRGYQEIIEKLREEGKSGTLLVSITELTRLLEVAQRVERLARGQATSRTEVMVELIGTFVNEFAMIFLSVNDIGLDEGREERKREYIRRCDEMLREIYPQAKAGTLRLGRG